ncbi:hypothetical protein Tco_1304335 [Tanacetum coccineum]
MKVFNNMKRPTKGYSGQEVALFPFMLHGSAPSTSPSRITSSPSYSPEHSPSPTPSPSPEPTPDHTIVAATQPLPTQPSPTQPATEHHLPTPHDLPLHAVHSHGSDEGSLKLNELTDLVTKLSDRIGVLEDDLRTTKTTYTSAFTKLILRVKKLEAQIKIGKARRRARVVFSDDEVIEDDSSKQGRKLSNAEVQEKASTGTELFVQEVTPTEVIQDQGGSEKGSAEVSTAEVNLSTAGGIVTYTRRSAEKRSRQDKGKAIMIESEPKKKSKKELKQERLSFAKAIRLEEQMNEEQRAQIARDEEIARQWDEEERQRAMAEAKSTKKIDWNDPSVIRYHTLKMKPKTVAQARRNMIKYLKNQGNYKISDFKGMSYNEIRPIFEKVWDFNQHIEPMEHGTKKMKSPKKIVEQEVDTQEEMKEVVKEPGAKRKKSIPRKSTRKRQKMEEDAEKEELKGFLDIIPREEVPIKVESISTKFPIVDWKTCVLTETIIKLVKEKYSPSRLEGFDLMLKGDLYTLFESDEEGEIWKNQHEYNLISWRLCDICGIHILLMENGLAIHMLTEKKYPLSQEMLSKMLSRKLEVDHESSQNRSRRGINIRQRLQATRDRQRSYANVRRKPLEFQVGDRVMLKVSPRKGVIRFGKRGKLNSRYFGPFKILERIGPMAYKLELPKELSNVHSTFHVSNLKKCLSDESIVIPMKELRIDDKLNFVEEQVEIMDREVKQLRQSCIPIIKVRWSYKRGPEFTWEHEDQIRAKYLHLFSNITSASN